MCIYLTITKIFRLFNFLFLIEIKCVVNCWQFLHRLYLLPRPWPQSWRWYPTAQRADTLCLCLRDPICGIWCTSRCAPTSTRNINLNYKYVLKRNHTVGIYKYWHQLILNTEYTSILFLLSAFTWNLVRHNSFKVYFIIQWFPFFLDADAQNPNHSSHTVMLITHYIFWMCRTLQTKCDFDEAFHFLWNQNSELGAGNKSTMLSDNKILLDLLCAEETWQHVYIAQYF